MLPGLRRSSASPKNLRFKLAGNRRGGARPGTAFIDDLAGLLDHEINKQPDLRILKSAVRVKTAKADRQRRRIFQNFDKLSALQMLLDIKSRPVHDPAPSQSRHPHRSGPQPPFSEGHHGC